MYRVVFDDQNKLAALAVHDCLGIDKVSAHCQASANYRNFVPVIKEVVLAGRKFPDCNDYFSIEFSSVLTDLLQTLCGSV